jgi:hypothetical protein
MRLRRGVIVSAHLILVTEQLSQTGTSTRPMLIGEASAWPKVMIASLSDRWEQAERTTLRPRLERRGKIRDYEIGAVGLPLDQSERLRAACSCKGSKAELSYHGGYCIPQARTVIDKKRL